MGCSGWKYSENTKCGSNQNFGGSNQNFGGSNQNFGFLSRYRNTEKHHQNQPKITLNRSHFTWDRQIASHRPWLCPSATGKCSCSIQSPRDIALGCENGENHWFRQNHSKPSTLQQNRAEKVGKKNIPPTKFSKFVKTTLNFIPTNFGLNRTGRSQESKFWVVAGAYRWS